MSYGVVPVTEDRASAAPHLESKFPGNETTLFRTVRSPQSCAAFHADAAQGVRRGVTAACRSTPFHKEGKSVRVRAMHPLLKEILTHPPSGQHECVHGWVRSKRETKRAVFISLSDGSCPDTLQVTVPLPECSASLSSGAQAEQIPNVRDAVLQGETLAQTLKRVTTGACIRAEGALVPSPGAGQALELRACNLTVLGEAPAETYPLQKKSHSFEFLRAHAHLRARTSTFAACARVRSALAGAVHRFFSERHFQYVHTPIITASDCEGAGELFRVTTFDPVRIAREAHAAGAAGNPYALTYADDFFGKAARLTVSGQLQGEAYALALTRIYTFGPTFRAENSNTSRHLSEFWMVEPEIAFARITDCMDVAEEFLAYLLRAALKDCAQDIAFLDERAAQHARSARGDTPLAARSTARTPPVRTPGQLTRMLEDVARAPATRLTYTEAIKLLENSGRSFEFPVRWGCDLQSEHECFLTEEVFHGPVIVYDYPKEIKAFYMKLNADGTTVRSMDLLVPGLGEIMGGSEREEQFEVLDRKSVV